MKIGIITIFDSENFGNRLQNYALQQVLSGYGEEVVTLRNKPEFRSLWERLRRGTRLAESVKLNLLLGKRRKARILEFHNAHIAVSTGCYCCGATYASLKPGDRCDRYCIGSDQVWNPDLGRTGGFNYASFSPEAAFSYGASFGPGALPEESREKLGRWLSRIPYLSLREEAGAGLLRELTGREDGQILVDPTLLLHREQWEKLEKKPISPMPENYLLAYFLGPVSPARRSALEDLAGRQGLEILDIMDPSGPFYEIGPGEFLYLVRRGRLVCTDSFHASVFSFLFRRPLGVFPRGETWDSRLETFARTFHLEHCLVTEDTCRDLPEKADYGAGFLALEGERQKAKAYLDQVFAGSEGGRL